MEGLTDRSLVIVAGKGGVGKTTTSCAIALELAKQGRKTLLVTVDPAKRLEDALGVDVGFKETPIQPNLTALMLDPEAVIKEHLEAKIPQAAITEHPLFKYVTKTMPGLNEMMAIGKLNDLRRAGTYDAIVIDTAPTGHALSFLSVPQAMKEIMSEKSLLKWAMRGYQVWQKLQGATTSLQNVFKKKDERRDAPPEIDFEAIFADIESEAQAIQSFLADPDASALVLVTLPEKLPVEETIDLHAAVTDDLGMRVFGIVVNKMQPDALQGVKDEFDKLKGDAKKRKAFVAAGAKAGHASEALMEALLHATEFAEVRRQMNLEYVADLEQRLPDVPQVLMPLFKHDVQGLRRLKAFQKRLFP